MAIDPLADTSEQPAAASRVPQQRRKPRPRPTQDAPRTTYYGGRPDRMIAYTASRPGAGAQRS